jgi:hypothetical protein
MAGQSIVRVEGHCEACFIEVYIDPIKKEVRNSEEVLQHLNDALYIQLQRLGAARKVQLSGAPRAPYKCHKCHTWSPSPDTDSPMLHLIWHEEHCTGTKHIKPNGKAPRTDSGQRRLKVNKARDEEILI